MKGDPPTDWKHFATVAGFVVGVMVVELACLLALIDYWNGRPA